MSILKGRINPIEIIPAVFDDKTIGDEDGYPLEFSFTSLVFSRDEESGETVFSPDKNTKLIIYDTDEISYNWDECYSKFGVSIFAFVDLYVARMSEEVRGLVDNAIVSREYMVE